MKFKKLLLFSLPFFIFLGFFVLVIPHDSNNLGSDIISAVRDTTQVMTSPTPTIVTPPAAYEIPLRTHEFQSFNNCGPATLAMALSYAGIQKNQTELGNILRPYQVPGGDNDDKSVSLSEVAAQAETYGLVAYLRPNGDIEKIKQLTSAGIPVIARTWLHPNEDIGHYRIIRGYDDNTREIIQDDSFEGKNLRYSYETFNGMWEPFNYEYLVLAPKEKEDTIKRILGDDLDEHTAWQHAKVRAESTAQNDPENVHMQFALSRIYYYLGDYKKSVEHFNSVENKISFRTLWYQIEPLQAIYETGDYNRVLSISETILNNQNRAYSELYILRGKIFQEQGNTEAARAEYANALLYNKNIQIPQL